MATIATIAAITGTGTVYAVNAQGAQRVVQAGSTLEAGETLRTVGNVQVDLMGMDGNMLHVNPDQVVKLDDNVFKTDQTPTTADAALTTPVTADTVIQALDRGQDLSTALDATAAGLDGGGGGGGSTFVQLGRISEGVSGNTYGFDFSGLGVPAIDVGVGQVVTATAAVGTVTATISINPVAGDGVISAAERTETTVVSGTVGGDAKVGDTVTLTVNGTLYLAKVEAGPNGTFIYSTEVKTSDLEASGRVDASYTATSADGTESATVTTHAAVVTDYKADATITIDPIGDDVITPAEAADGQRTTITGTVTGDAKVGDTVTILVNGHSYQGSVSQGEAGLVFSVPNVLVSDLAADKTIDASITVTDPYGNQFTAHDTHTVTGSSTISNDGQAVTEDANVSEGGTLNAHGAVVLTATTSDGSGVVNPATLKQVSAGEALGTLSVHADGSYDFSVANSTVQNLAAGESVVQTYEVQSADGTATSTITITIYGSNDAPRITTASDLSGGVVEDGKQVATGTIVSTDVDHHAVLTFTASGGPAPANEWGSGGGYGTFGVDSSTGDWTYTLDNGRNGTYDKTQQLAQGETRTETYTVTVTDEHGASASENVVITITGTNDAPTILSQYTSTSGAVAENTLGVATGNVSAQDVDNGAQLTFAVDGANSSSYGSFSVQYGQWTYQLNGESAAVHALGAGETVQETYTVLVTDEHGAAVRQNVVITITGSNDAPQISGASDAAGDVKEDTTLQASGTIVATDVDHHAVLTFSASGGPQAEGEGSSGAYGSFGVDASTGAWTYTLDNGTNGSNTQTQRLAEGETRTETYKVTVTDEHGASATESVVITITGTNDAPTLSSGSFSGSVLESTTLTTSGTVQGIDVDNGAKLSYSLDGATSSGYGSFSLSGGQWTYQLNDTALVRSLGTGDTVHETYTVRVTDEHGAFATKDVLITITGINHPPSVDTESGNPQLAVDESGLALGTQAGHATTSTNGTFALGDGDGLNNLDHITVGGQMVSMDDLANSGTSHVSLALDDGTFLITGYSAGVVSYTFTLGAAIHSTEGQGANLQNNALAIAVTVVDKELATASDVIHIAVKDDAPLLQVTNAVLHSFNSEDSSGSHANNGFGNGDQTAPGNSNNHNNAENAGGDGSTSSSSSESSSSAFSSIAATGSLVVMGADTEGSSIHWTTRPEGLTSNGLEVKYSEQGNVLTGYTGEEGHTTQVFTMTANANGTYEFVQLAALSTASDEDNGGSEHSNNGNDKEHNDNGQGNDGEGKDHTDSGDCSTANTLVFGFTATDGDADTANGTVSITLENSTLTHTANASDVYKLSYTEGDAISLQAFDASHSSAKGGDVLDLRDLLVNEHSADGTFNLDKYLHFSEEGSGQNASVVISVDHNGSSTSSAFAADQHIKLENMTLTSLKDALGAGSTSDVDLIHKMLDHGNLKTDT